MQTRKCRRCLNTAGMTILLAVMAFKATSCLAQESVGPSEATRPAAPTVSIMSSQDSISEAHDAWKTAMEAGDLTVCRRLLDSGMDVNAVISGSGKTPLMAARSAGLARLLLSYGADPNVRDYRGATALHHVVLHRDALRIIPLLIEKGADVNAAADGWSGETPFLFARRLFMQRQDSVQGADVLRLLARLGADINAVDNEGYTLLIHAVVNDKPDLVALMVELGVDLMVRTREGQTASDWAEELGFVDIAEMLEAARSTH